MDTNQSTLLYTYSELFKIQILAHKQLQEIEALCMIPPNELSISSLTRW